ncbi:MAG TPA: ferredoxin [Planctomycetes bacterium]|nr:ferredoxin [Planctomycetota bacterium]
MKIQRVWIDEGCISCSLCQDYCPEVFLVQDGEDCVIHEEAVRFYLEKEEDIHLAAEDCPVEVIKIVETALEDSAST